MAGYRKLEDLDITKEEINQIGEALKKEEFRKLLADYVQEVNDPENKKLFQKEVTELEKERGYDVTFINPEPGYVIKTSVDGEKKAFINICKSDKVQKPTSAVASEEGSVGKRWSLPYTQAPPREDLDKSGNRCVVYDVVFHPETLQLSKDNTQFKNMLNETALDAVEKSFNACLDRKNIKFPQINYKGGAYSTVIRKKSAIPPPPLDENDPLSKMKFPFDYEPEQQSFPKKNIDKKPSATDSSANKTPYTTPKYTIKHRNTVDLQEYTNDRNSKLNATLPNEIIVEIELPLLSSTSEAILDVTEKSLSLQSEKPAKYKLHITLPFTVDEDAGNAKFDKAKRKLCVTLPLKYRKHASFSDFGREDSGVESDIGQRTPESSSGEDDSIETEVNKISVIEEIENCENNNSVLEEKEHVSKPEETRTKELVSVLDNEVFRTNKNMNKKFLNPELYYSFPSFSCNVIENDIAFVLHVKNVDPNTVEKCILEDCSGFHVKFTSIGSGFFPIHHSFCAKFPTYSSITEDSLNIETWDNNIIVQIQLNLCDTNVGEYYAGVDEDTLVKHELPELTIIAKKFEELQVSTEENNFDIQVTNQNKDETVIELTSIQKFEKETAYVINQEEKGSESSEENTQPENGEDKKKTKHPMLKCRTLSESSGDEMNFSPTKKGILKRVSRSLSESSVEEYTWSSSLDMFMKSGSETCIPEEGKEMKKTVRFNEVVHEKTFRTNSSILGQRKKNQRKFRNKKRAQERRASESENSEGENEKGKENKTVKDGEEEVDDDDEEDSNNVPNAGDLTENAEEVFETEVKLQDEKPAKTSKQNSQVHAKGKKRIHKVGEAAKEQNNTSKVDLKNELIFNLDM